VFGNMGNQPTKPAIEVSLQDTLVQRIREEQDPIKMIELCSVLDAIVAEDERRTIRARLSIPIER
jgi:hypothetical protein